LRRFIPFAQQKTQWPDHLWHIGKSNNAAHNFSGIEIHWIGMNGLNATNLLTKQTYRRFFMPITIASIMNLMGPDMMVILLIVLLLFGAKKLPELARGMGRAVKEFGAARDEVERNLSQSGPNGVEPSKLLDAKSELPSARS
jgi:sec-independent protein translocase protein TatA